MSHHIVPSGEGKSVSIGGLGIVFKIKGEATGGLFSIVEHPLAPRALGAAMHRHRNEDECSFVIEGRIGARLGDVEVEAGPGDYIFKPRNQWHTFWNAGDEPARFLEIITPAGFENYFEELPSCFTELGPDFPRLMGLASRFDLEVDPTSIPELVQKHSLVTA
jgi:mannose-6-phosphate isomerase-like protein (cupin superfamily)